MAGVMGNHVVSAVARMSAPASRITNEISLPFGLADLI